MHSMGHFGLRCVFLRAATRDSAIFNRNNQLKGTNNGYKKTKHPGPLGG